MLRLHLQSGQSIQAASSLSRRETHNRHQDSCLLYQMAKKALACLNGNKGTTRLAPFNAQGVFVASRHKFMTCRQSGSAPSRAQSGDSNSMQHGLEAIFKLGSDAVGRSVHVFQSAAGSWYNAHIKQSRPRQGILNVQYESGDQAALKAKEEHTKFNIRLMPISVRRP